MVNSLQNEVRILKQEKITLMEKSQHLEKQLEELSNSKSALLKVCYFSIPLAVKETFRISIGTFQ